MRIAVGSDHRGVEMRAAVARIVAAMGHEVVDMGTREGGSVDYPDVAAIVAGAVSTAAVDRGILVCGTGLGMAIAANKFPGVRAVPCHDDQTAELSRRHNNANVLCLSGDMLSQRGVDRLLQIWLDTAFEGGRHALRLEKIRNLEQGKPPA